MKLASLLTCFAFAVQCHAASLLVHLDTSDLIGHPDSPFTLVLYLTDGEGVGDANTNVTAGPVVLGGGTALGAPAALGGATGSLDTGITIVDSSFFNLFQEQFSAGSYLEFMLSLTSTIATTDVSDRVVLLLLDGAGVPIPTIAPIGDVFLSFDISSGAVVTERYASDSSRPLSVGGPVAIGPPLLIETVPEPLTSSLIFFGLIAIFTARRCSRLARELNSTERA